MSEAADALQEAVEVFLNFLSEEDGNKLVMVADPPFGGLVKLLDGSVSEMPMVWIFPYFFFFEPRIRDCFPAVTMLDYQVMTNIICQNRENILRWNYGITSYVRFCSICERYVSAENRHCPDCNACTSKVRTVLEGFSILLYFKTQDDESEPCPFFPQNGRRWRHCAECGKCVKPSWRHCSSCGRCVLPDHRCGQTGCYNCGDPGHRHKACPLKHKKKNMQIAKGANKHSSNMQTAKKKRNKNAQKKKRVT
ncbi:Zinc finger CCHC domain-containing protein 4 [Bagarius yarrelli]|uniref:Zinc finger CCHC domain-containing protein 4 n=1 Tax=Bagarius yarrelli TaxID=175774 RepID=A0A556V8M6_BAGYA|nr:Zinc finger CCHC domain-containing protein 4 [Bagarius yarrelli]